MATVAMRECGVLATGCLIAWLFSLVFANGNVPPNPIYGLILPIVLCLTRAAMAGIPDPHWTAKRRVARQVTVSLALIFLFVFEVGFGLLVGARGVPPVAWGVIAILGIAYVWLFCIAHAIETYMTAPSSVLDRVAGDSEYIVMPTNQ